MVAKVPMLFSGRNSYLRSMVYGCAVRGLGFNMRLEKCRCAIICSALLAQQQQPGVLGNVVLASNAKLHSVGFGLG